MAHPPRGAAAKAEIDRFRRPFVAGRAAAGPPPAHPGNCGGSGPAGKKGAAKSYAPPSAARRRAASRQAVARKFALSETAVRAIEAEGLANDWPPL